MDPAGSTVTWDWVFADTLETHGTVVFAGLLKHVRFRPRYQDLGFVHIDLKSLSFHARLPEDQHLLWFLQRFRDDNQVICICIQVFLGTSCAKLLGFRPGGAQVRALVNSHFQSELFTQVVTNTHSASGIFILCMRYASHCATPSLRRAHQVWVKYQRHFPDRQRSYQGDDDIFLPFILSKENFSESVPAALLHFIRLIPSWNRMLRAGLSTGETSVREAGSQLNYTFERRQYCFLCCLIRPVVVAQLSSVIVDRFLALDIQVATSHLVGEADYVGAAGWGILENSAWYFARSTACLASC